MDQAVSLFTEDGLKRAAALCAVHRPVFRPPGIPAVEIAKLHRATLLDFSSGFFILPSHGVHPFPCFLGPLSQCS